MKKRLVLTGIVLLALTAAVFAATVKKYPKELAQELITAYDDSMFPKIFKMTMKMNTVRAGKKPLTFEYLIWSKGNDNSLMEIIFPARDKGKKILLKQDNLWMYIPDVSRPVRLSRKQSFMGSTFSNEDLMNSTIADDYDAEITAERGNEYYLVLTAKRRDVAYAKIDLWIDKDKRIPSESTYYGLSGKAIKKMTYGQMKEFAGRLRPSYMKMADLLEEGAYTEITIGDITELKEVPAHIFDQTQMGR